MQYNNQPDTTENLRQRPGDISFLNNEETKTKSNAIKIPSINLPKGGGAIKSIDEKFAVNAITGSASFAIPLPFASARGATPALSLSYDSGAGNSIFGLGWQLSLPAITRKTDKELPQYLDSIDSDTFLLSDAEDLVPEFKREADGSFAVDANGDFILNEKDSADNLWKLRYYRPRTEGLFARIERWMEKTSGKIRWRLTTRENLTTLFGWSEGSVIADPQDDRKIFKWLPEFVFDDKGNCSHYRYKPEDDKGFDAALLHNRNRIAGGKITYINTYLEKIFYGNKSPYKKFGDAFPPADEYMFETVLDFGEYEESSPFSKLHDWTFRPDAFSDYKAGFEIRTTRLCKRVLLFHHFTGQDEYDGLVRSADFEHDTSIQQGFTFLKKATSRGYIKKPDNSYSFKQFPFIEFEYQPHDWSREVKTIAAENLVHAPGGPDQETFLFTDLFNEGLAGILTEQGGGWYYKHNLGDGRFEQAKLVGTKPSVDSSPDHLQLVDLDADGGKQLVRYDGEPKGFFELSDDEQWRPFKNFKHVPNIEYNDPYTRLIDLDGDGMSEILITEDNVLTWYRSEGRHGYSPARKTLKSIDEEKGPNIVFADSKQTIFLADMSGSGMTDIVRIRNGEICYWPNLGYGKFGAKVNMDHAPIFDHPDRFNSSYLRLADIDGSGTTDIIYLGKNKVTCWMNLSGNSFSETPFEIDHFPEIHEHTTITVTDLLGNGVPCIAWTGGLPKYTSSPLRYIDLMSGKKPHVMIFYKNNLGKEVRMEYTASTKFYIEDKLAGTPWVTKLHFPVHCISRTETVDKITGWTFVSSYKYHHGYYDHHEREFRGFGMVEQTDAEQFDNWIKGNATNVVEKKLHQDPVLTRSWFHTGAFFNDKILDQFEDGYWYKEMERQGFPVVHSEVALPEAKIIAGHGIDPSFTDHLSAEERIQASRCCKGLSLRSEVFTLDELSPIPTDDEIKKSTGVY